MTRFFFRDMAAICLAIICSYTAYGFEPTEGDIPMDADCHYASFVALSHLKESLFNGVDETVFISELKKRYSNISCEKEDGFLRIEFLPRATSRGGDAFYRIKNDSFEIVEAVFGR